MQSLEQLRGADTVLLSTRRRDGRIVNTPVNLVVDGSGYGYFRTSPTSGKAKRLANYSGVRLAPCTRRGRPEGSDQPGVCTPVTGDEAARAQRLLGRRFPLVQGLLLPAVDRLWRRSPAYFRVISAEEPTPWEGLGR